MTEYSPVTDSSVFLAKYLDKTKSEADLFDSEGTHRLILDIFAVRRGENWRKPAEDDEGVVLKHPDGKQLILSFEEDSVSPISSTVAITKRRSLLANGYPDVTYEFEQSKKYGFMVAYEYKGWDGPMAIIIGPDLGRYVLQAYTNTPVKK
jgi:hypothetical protein